MAEALARHFAADVIEASSAGLNPFGEIIARTRETLAEIGVGVEGQSSKAIRPEALDGAGIVVNLTGRPGEAVFRGNRKNIEDWDVSDPYGEDVDMYRRIRNEIELRVRELAERLRKMYNVGAGGKVD